MTAGGSVGHNGGEVTTMKVWIRRVGAWWAGLDDEQREDARAAAFMLLAFLGAASLLFTRSLWACAAAAAGLLGLAIFPPRRRGAP